MNSSTNFAGRSPILLPDSVLSLTTTWRLEAPIQQVWEAITQVNDWPRWWRDVQQVTTLEPGDAEGLGARHRFSLGATLPYRVRFDTCITWLQAPYAMDTEVSGDLSGQGRWRLFRTGSMTLVRYQWDVMPTKPRMRRLAPYARALFAWNHERVMHRGGQALAHWLRGA